MDPIRFQEVWRGYRGVPVLKGLDFAVPKGSITAFVGRNGSGKTTAIKCMLGLLRTERGLLYVLGRQVSNLDIETLQRIGYLSERPMLDQRWRVCQALELSRMLNPRWDEALEASLLDRLDLDPRFPIAALSLGQTRKLGLVIALAARPELLVLDEPAGNLDVVVRREFLDAVLELFRSEGMTVLLSTHLLNEAERIADRVVFLEGGRCQLDQNLDDLKDSVKALRIAPRNGAVLAAPQIEGTLLRRQAGREWLVTVQGFRQELVARLEGELNAFVEVRDLNLEDIFIACTLHAQEATP